MNGETDTPLTQLGVKQAKAASGVIKDIQFHQAYTSELQRAQRTLNHVLIGLGQPDLPVTHNSGLNERRYGVYEGIPIAEMVAKIGEPAATAIRQNWEEPIPGGETLKQTHDRVVKYYQKHILPDLKRGKNVIVAAHRNVLRTLAKYLDQLPDDDIKHFTLENGEVDVYDIDPETGTVKTKEIRIAKIPD
jgi:2,3-bisphosphoglycerate-dependent phosphoglycerate mutase